MARTHLWTGIVGLWLVSTCVIARGEVVARFSGSGPGSTEPFRTEQPWMLTWGVNSEFPMLSHMEIHLYDVNTGRHVGIVDRHSGIGNGKKLIREPGRYRLSIIGQSIDWDIVVQTAEQELAEIIRDNPNVTEVRLLSPNAGLVRELVEKLAGWQAEDEKTLLLRTEDGIRVRARFYDGESCPGLLKTRNIFFVTSDYRADNFNAIILEDGTRCYLDRVVQLN